MFKIIVDNEINSNSQSLLQKIWIFYLANEYHTIKVIEWNKAFMIVGHELLKIEWNAIKLFN